MSVTAMLRPWMLRPLRSHRQAHADPEAAQRSQLAALLRAARSTAWGRQHGYGRLASYADYAEAVPITPYQELRPWVMRMVAGETSVLWPGRCRRFAQSSGTSDGRSKYIPITDESLRANHYHGPRVAVAAYLEANPASRLLDGRALILGGSFASQLQCPRGTRAGDLSATLIERVPRGVDLLRVPSRSTALMADWGEKLPRLAAEVARSRGVTNLSGVPSWMLTVLRQVLAVTGCDTVAQVWPRLEVFFHGGIAMGPYREEYRRVMGSPSMAYVETYNASEGFFAVQDTPGNPAMALLLDAGMVYELRDIATDRVLPCWEAEAGRCYSLVVSGCNGLWRFEVGDVVRVEAVSPLRVTIAGRTKHYINAFGEELMVHNADAALARTCARHGCSVADYTAAPLFTPGGLANGCHEWLVEFAVQPPSAERFAADLDAALRDLNSDYDAKRTSDIFLSPLRLHTAPPGTFERWLAATGRLGGQRKVPRLCNDRRYLDPLLAEARRGGQK